ncbi:hypothetical protein [Amycolatopsis regifaucium]|uniref:Uncharacterized protein n=1 Tax=Amycolatopsis regifaucium TaxID=546365 RepID=A0A154M486_9PSEU|nr:hypothetical protein [Amycolatopsis regifaucium]KZB79422.1 hypothetical protein AVL48_17730 [Amycolatopsis regifaucium]OKA07603.1 hypothetical protein ATP06_0217415 [Amycolatopsis regifaucium]SFH07315.1 hypothetical protein SAMN04489731_102330 [Amycolatopsis regifaucium]
MSHSLGPLAHNLAAYAIYSTAQTEMRHAYKLIESGDYLGAAAEIDSAAHAAEVLARATSDLDAERSERWLRVVVARRRFAEQARAHAGAEAALAA